MRSCPAKFTEQLRIKKHAVMQGLMRHTKPWHQD